MGLRTGQVPDGCSLQDCTGPGGRCMCVCGGGGGRAERVAMDSKGAGRGETRVSGRKRGLVSRGGALKSQRMLGFGDWRWRRWAEVEISRTQHPGSQKRNERQGMGSQELRGERGRLNIILRNSIS